MRFKIILFIFLKAGTTTEQPPTLVKKIGKSETDIGDIHLTMEIIKTNGYTLQQIFNSHSLVNDFYQCKLCSKRISDRNSFIAHLRIHLGDWIGRCSKCNKGFSRKAHLQNHEKICNYEKEEVSFSLIG